MGTVIEIGSNNNNMNSMIGSILTTVLWYGMVWYQVPYDVVQYDGMWYGNGS